MVSNTVTKLQKHKYLFLKDDDIKIDNKYITMQIKLH